MEKDSQLGRYSSFDLFALFERAFLINHSFLIIGQGMLDLYDATFDVEWLDFAVKLQVRL